MYIILYAMYYANDNKSFFKYIKSLYLKRKNSKNYTILKNKKGINPIINTYGHDI